MIASPTTARRQSSCGSRPIGACFPDTLPRAATRATAPAGAGALYHHIGVYAFRRAALDRFVALPPSPLEQREELEQLRALEAGMRVDVALPCPTFEDAFAAVRTGRATLAMIPIDNSVAGRVDDPARFVQEIEYEAHEDWELNRQRIASDVRMQTYLQAWRAMLPGALEIDVYQEV